MSIWSKFSLAFLFCILTYFTFWPTGADPVAWNAPEEPKRSGIYEINKHLEKAEMIGVGTGYAGEDVAIDSQGRIYTGYNDGRIVRFQKDGKQPEVLTNTGGRPLGLDFDNDGNLIIADADKGLLSLSPQGELEVLTTGTDSYQLVFTDDVDVAPDGQIYFSDASSKYNRHALMKDLIEHRPHGLLVRYNPSDQSTKILMRDLYFANGIAVSPDNSFLLVVETTAYRVRKVWLTPGHEPESEIIIDNLPGMPDGISSGKNGRFWLPLVAPRSGLLDNLSNYPGVRNALLRVPKSIQPKPVNYGFVLALDAKGKVIHNLQGGSENTFAPISSVEEWGDHIYLGSLSANSIARLPLP